MAEKHSALPQHAELNLEHLGFERLTFFSDAVFAIAITLLAIEIRLPETGEHLAGSQLVETLLEMWPEYLAYVISFMVIGLFWLGHHRKFRLIRRLDTGLVLVNLVMLMLVAFTPFPTSVISAYGTQSAVIVYAVYMLLLGLANLGLWVYANRRDLVDPGMSPAARQQETRRAASVPAVFVISILLAFIHPVLAMFSWALVAIALQSNMDKNGGNHD